MISVHRPFLAPLLAPLLALLGVLLVGCGGAIGPVGSADPPASGPPVERESLPGTFAAEATAVRVLPEGRGFAITVEVPAGERGCATDARARYDGDDYGRHHVTTVYDSAGGRCPDSLERTVELRVPPQGRDLVLNNAAWRPGPDRSYVQCSDVLGCRPPADRCADAWVQQLLSTTELPPERDVDVLGCDGAWMVLAVDAVVTGCQPIDGASPPPGCAGSGVHTRWFARLDAERHWEVVASGRSAGCADVADVPAFPRRLCEALPAV